MREAANQAALVLAGTLLFGTSLAYGCAKSQSPDSTNNGPTDDGGGNPGLGSSGATNSGSSSAADEDSSSSIGSGSSAVGSGASTAGSGASTAGSTASGSNAGGPDATVGAVADASANTASGGFVRDGDAGACPAPSGITAQQTTALQIINQTRQAVGAPCANMAASLNTSATKHCVYYADNLSSGTCIADPHVEVSGCKGYVAANFGDRETDAGYVCQPSLNQNCEAFEVMAFNDNPTYALDQWIGSIYHRTPVLDPWTRDFGYGGATMCDTIDFGEGAGSTTPTDVIVSYPYDGQTGVPLSFDGAEEEPMPPVPPNGWPSAFPIHVYMHATTITLTTDEFSVEGGAMLAHQNMLPQTTQGYVADAMVLYGNAPLASKTKYRVHVAGTRTYQPFFGQGQSAPFDVSFAFTTQ